MQGIDLRGTLLLLVGLLCGSLMEVPSLSGRAVAQGKTGSAAVALADLTPVRFPGDQKELKLDGEIVDRIIAGGGRYLILRLKDDRQLLVFDTSKAEIVQKLRLTSDNFLVAASAKHLLVVFPDTKTIERWSLSSFSMEKEVPLPCSDPVKAIAIGYASEGPLVLLTEDRKYFEQCQFMDPGTLRLKQLEPLYEKVAEAEIKNSHRRFMAKQGRIELPLHSYGFIRPSANGRIVVSGTSVMLLTEKNIQYFWGSARGFPDVAGNFIYTPRFTYSTLLERVRQIRSYGTPFPAVQTGVYLSLDRKGIMADTELLGLSVQLNGDHSLKAFIPKVDLKLSAPNKTCQVPLEKRFTLIPEAHLLVQIPNTSDRLILHKVDLDQLLKEEKSEYAFVTSIPPAETSPGSRYQHQLQSQSSQKVSYELVEGPENMSVSKAGLISWSVPADIKTVNVPVRIKMTVGASKTTNYAFFITVPEATGKHDPFDVAQALKRDASDAALKVASNEKKHQEMLDRLAKAGPAAKQLVESRAMSQLKFMEKNENQQLSTFEVRTWKDVSGNELEAQLIEAFGGKVKLKSLLSGDYDVSLTELSSDDQKYIRETLAAAREARKRAQRAEPPPDSPHVQMRLIYAGMQSGLRQLRGVYPSARVHSREGEPLLSWRVHLLRYLGGEELYKLFRQNEPWDSEHNRRLIPLMPDFYRTPKSKAGEGKTNLKVVMGEHCLFKERGAVGLTDITDELDQTVMLVEVPDELAVVWTKPEDWEFRSESAIKTLFGFHTAGFYALFADGTVKLISSENSLKDISRTFLRDDGGTVELK